MTNGIYTLANDVVLDQLIALLNSIEVNGGNTPVCVIAYDDRIEGVKAEIENRGNPNITLFNDRDVFLEWEDFSYDLWKTHPTALSSWQEQGVKTRFYRVGENHRYCGFDPSAPFDKFIYMDADTLLLSPVDFIFEKLDGFDFVVYDFQYKDPGHIYNLNSSKLFEVFPRERIEKEIFCSGFYGAKRGCFPAEKRCLSIEKLANGDADILYVKAPNQSVLNYLIMSNNLSVFNFGLALPKEERTGNSVTSPHFEMRDGLLYDHEKRITFLHYIGLSSRLFSQVSAGVNLDFPYRDLFLHYRFLKNPEQRPQFSDRPQAWDAPPSFWQKLNRKLSGLLKKV